MQGESAAAADAFGGNGHDLSAGFACSDHSSLTCSVECLLSVEQLNCWCGVLLQQAEENCSKHSAEPMNGRYATSGES